MQTGEPAISPNGRPGQALVAQPLEDTVLQERSGVGQAVTSMVGTAAGLGPESPREPHTHSQQTGLALSTCHDWPLLL